MKRLALAFLALPGLCWAQTPQDIPISRLHSVLDLPLDQAVKQRETYKQPLKAAYERQTALIQKDCQLESQQLAYNICMGQASEQADKDYATFYNNLQMLCHNDEQLAGLQAFEKVWLVYRNGGVKATRFSWPNGTAASGVVSRVYLSMVRQHMSVLLQIYDLNVSQ
jgi:uncharacterized protein YecT (DUF1311 family)